MVLFHGLVHKVVHLMPRCQLYNHMEFLEPFMEPYTHMYHKK
jgi:hypothetical protein